jgi:hypothetical protein
VHRGTVLIVALLATVFVACESQLVPAPTRSPGPTGGPTASPRPSPTASPTGRPTATPLPVAGPHVCRARENPEWSVARRWNEALLDAIRRSLPNPPVHARNLFHLSVAMWDAWAVYDPVASGYVVSEKDPTTDGTVAAPVAISYAAWTVLRHRFRNAIGADESLEAFDEVLRILCLPIPRTIDTEGASPTEVGLRVGASVVEHGLIDGSNEDDAYAAGDYEPVNQPLVVSATARFRMADANRWQPLEIPGGQTQNGITTAAVQVAIGPHWGHVLAFGATDLEVGVPIDPGPPPMLGDPATDAVLKAQVVDIIRNSAALDTRTGSTIDISPAARGANPLGTNDGQGYRLNPITGSPYASFAANSADLYRVMAEYWADGPRSETPPGHWNVIANTTSDSLEDAGQLRVGGVGPTLQRLDWDVRLYLAINGAVHNAAIAAWGLKGRYDSVRPISLIRYMGGKGQSSDPALPSYHAKGLPLVPGLIELVTAESAAAGERHERLSASVGRVAVRAWRASQTGRLGARWMLATAWTPYQLPSFVTPSFPGYVSGHSTFSRAAAEVLTAFTGSEYFPGGLLSLSFEEGSLGFEAGPTSEVRLEWATYYDAADQAGQSRLFGGIHIQADDLTGRRIGSTCGLAAYRLALQYFAGEVTPDSQACAE